LVGDHIHGFDVGRLSEQLLCPGHQSGSEASAKVGRRAGELPTRRRVATSQGMPAIMPSRGIRAYVYMGRCLLPAAYVSVDIGSTPADRYYNQGCQAPTF
jgi:hypothetical protein